MSNNALVGIFCVTYNHEKYIKDCLEGFVKQKTNFKFEAVVYDDCSTDDTRDIIKEYAKKFPDIIKPILSEVNIAQSKGFYYLNERVHSRLNSKYIAYCEGDDYWTDEFKLQKQVDFLEANPDYTVCFHPVKIVYQDFGFNKPDEIFPDEKLVKKGLNFDNLLYCNFIQTNSVMYRWAFNNVKFEKYYPKDIMPGDWYFHLLHAKRGKIMMLKDVMSVYRRNPNGIWSNVTNNDSLHLKYGIEEINFYYEVYKNIVDSSESYLNNTFAPALKNVLTVYQKHNQNEKVKKILEKYSDFIYPTLLYSIKQEEGYKKKYLKYKKLYNLILIIMIILILILFLFASCIIVFLS